MGPALRSSAFLLALAVAGPLAAQTIKVAANDKVDFAAFRSFAWKDTQEPAPRPLDHLQITRVVERELEAKGLAKAKAGQPDVVVRYFVKVEKRTKGTGRSEESTWQPSDRRTVVDFSRVEELKLILELYTPAGLEPVWSGTATETLAPAGRQDQQIEDTVAKLLAQYPHKQP
jgi:hypothetical protein